MFTGALPVLIVGSLTETFWVSLSFPTLKEKADCYRCYGKQYRGSSENFRKQNYHMIWHFCFRVYTQKNRKQGLEKTAVHPHS